MQNYGATAARNVPIAIDPWPLRTDGTESSEKTGIPSVISVLAPGQEWRAMCTNGLERKDSPHPGRGEGFVRYQGIGEAERTSHIVVDWSIYTTRRCVQVYGTHDAGRTLREMSRIIEKWNEGIHGVLAVYERDGDKRDSREAG